MIGDYIVNHFQHGFASDNLEISTWIEELIPPSLTMEDCSDLSALPLEEEIRLAIFQIGAHKAPGPDGMTG